MISIIRKQANNNLEELHGNGELKGYLDYYFTEETTNWYEPDEPNKRYRKRRIEAHRCQPEDFVMSEDEQSKALFDSWAGFLALCPDKDENLPM